MINPETQAIVWCIEHFNFVGWIALIGAGWKIMGAFKSLQIQASKTIGQIEKMSSNCFPTMQASLLNQDRLLHSMDESLKQIAAQTSKIKTPRKR